MAYQEEERKRRSRIRRIKVRIEKTLIALGMVLIVVLVGKGIVSKVVAQKKAEQQAEKKASTKKAAKEKAEEETRKKAEEARKKKETLENDPRKTYALDPAVAAGSDTQTDEKVVYLTFDDGPSANTKKILKVLDKYDAKATFFVTGCNEEYYDMIKTEYEKGHTIGLHTFSHSYKKIYASEDAYFKDLEKVGELVKKQIGYVPCFIRFPGGSSNTISKQYSKKIMKKLTKDVLKKGYQYYDWNADCGDASANNVAKSEIIKRACDDVPTNIVMLLHDASGKETTVEALPSIIKSYQKQGYVFKAIDRTSFDSHHKVNN